MLKSTHLGHGPGVGEKIPQSQRRKYELLTAGIIGLEKRYWKAMKENDVETAVALTRFSCVISGPQGTRKVTEEEYRGLMKSHKMDFKDITLKDTAVEFLNNNTALVTYSINFNEMDMLDVSTWVWEHGKWICTFHAENPLAVH